MAGVAGAVAAFGGWGGVGGAVCGGANCDEQRQGEGDEKCGQAEGSSGGEGGGEFSHHGFPGRVICWQFEITVVRFGWSSGC